MIISSKVELHKEEIEEEQKYLSQHKHDKSTTDIFQFENHLEPLSRKKSSIEEAIHSYGNRSIFERLDDHCNVTVLEQSLVVNGFAISEIIDPLHPEHKLAFTSRTNFWIGVGFLILMVVCMSAIGPVTVYLPAKNALVKQAWRTQGNLVLSIPIAWAVYRTHGAHHSFRHDFSIRVLMKSSLVGFLGFAWAASFVVGCSMTITSHAQVMYT
jgi:hypothetical protein